MTKKNIGILLLLFCISTSVIAQSWETGDKRFEVTLSTGYHQEDFNWSIAGNLQGENPNVFSELIWEDLSGVKAGAAFKARLYKSLAISVSYENTSISSGKVTDTDYQSDNRQDPSYFASLNSDRGNVSSLRNALAYQLKISERTTVSVFGGYVFNRQQLYLLEENANTSEEVKKLESTYQTNWKGFFTGADFRIRISDKIGFGIISAYEQLNYRAKANWNMIDAFAHPVSFIHTAKGYGLNNQLKAEFFLTSKFALHVDANYYYTVTAAGTDKLFMADGAVLYTRFNNACRNSYSISTGFSFSF